MQSEKGSCYELFLHNNYLIITNVSDKTYKNFLSDINALDIDTNDYSP